MEPESWWLPIWRFLGSVLGIEAVLCAACVGLALWRGWDIDQLCAAIITGGLALGFLGILPIFLRTPTIRFGRSGYRGLMDMAAQEAADMLPGGQNRYSTTTWPVQTMPCLRQCCSLPWRPHRWWWHLP